MKNKTYKIVAICATLFGFTYGPTGGTHCELDARGNPRVVHNYIAPCVTDEKVICNE